MPTWTARGRALVERRGDVVDCLPDMQRRESREALPSPSRARSRATHAPLTCGVCNDVFSRDEEIALCRVDQSPICSEHARICSSCGERHCTTHETLCEEGNHNACTTCVEACALCARPVCDAACKNHKGQLGPRRTSAVCRMCLSVRRSQRVSRARRSHTLRDLRQECLRSASGDLRDRWSRALWQAYAAHRRFAAPRLRRASASVRAASRASFSRRTR